MKDWNFLFNRYAYHIKIVDGYKWDFPTKEMLLTHDEDFLNDLILKEGEGFVDTGANVGAWSIRAAKFHSIVYAFEPNKNCFISLKRNIKLNNCYNVIPYNLALDNSRGFTNQNIHYPKVFGQPMGQDNVETKTLDDLDIKDLSLIKIDVEGAGYRVIAGGLQTILREHPTIIMEVHSEEESQIPRLLPSYGWEKKYRISNVGDWLYREDGKQIFLIGQS